jgi:serine/threonine protein kinase/tetratricopeptide (TPR) repeat protein
MEPLSQRSGPLTTLTVPEDPLVSALADEMGRRWRQGQRVHAELLLERHPELYQAPQRALGLIYEEICLRREYGLNVDAEEIFGRFPQWRTQLAVMLECHELLETRPTEPALPLAGESVAGYELLTPLGAGAGGRVFLARQPALADRPVVVKLTPLHGQEHLRLARLQHTHIVPLYAVHDEPAHNLRLLCMPYFGGAALDQVLRALAGQPWRQRSGASLLEVLHDAAVQPEGPAEPVLRRLSYVQALCWIGACLAEALHYAHEGGLLHLDLKPSNVLLTADGQPMLLDFHLARAPVQPGAAVPEGLGGTHGYMPPEQERALAAVAEGRPVPAAVDHRADIFGLGAVLYEALGGPLPFAPGRPPALHRHNVLVSVGLSDILEKCLAPAAADRYADAAGLARDLRAHLADRPLHGVRNRSWVERYHKWRRRRPTALRTALVLTALVGVLTVLTVGAVTQWSQLAGEAEHALQEGRQEWQERGQHGEALDRLRHGLEVARRLPLQAALVEQLQQEILRAEKGRLAQELHALAERVRVLYGVEALPAAQLRPLQESCRVFWQKRRQVKQWLAATPVPGAAEDLIDLVLFSTEVQLRTAPAGQEARARQELLAELEEAEELFGHSAVLEAERQRHRRALGLPTADRPAIAPRTEWEQFTLGRLALQAGELAQADTHLRQAVARLPNGFWPNYYYGLCAYRHGRPIEAIDAFSVCVGAAAPLAAVHYNRALAYAKLELREPALRDCDRALELDPTLACAALHRGMLHYEAKRHEAAEADLRRALQVGADAVTVHFDLALVYHAWKKDDRARQELALVLATVPDHAEARKLQARLTPR